MDTALHRRNFQASRVVGVTGALAGCVDPDVAVVAESVPTDREKSRTEHSNSVMVHDDNREAEATGEPRGA